MTKLDQAVWAACPHIKEWTQGRLGWTEDDPPQRINHTCQKCPHGDEEGLQRGCRGIAEELVKPITEALILDDLFDLVIAKGCKITIIVGEDDDSD